jgi:hypothetical protein
LQNSSANSLLDPNRKVLQTAQAQSFDNDLFPGTNIATKNEHITFSK